jgi:hypothetical protein
MVLNLLIGVNKNPFNPETQRFSAKSSSYGIGTSNLIALILKLNVLKSPPSGDLGVKNTEIKSIKELTQRYTEKTQRYTELDIQNLIIVPKIKNRGTQRRHRGSQS